MKVLLPALSRFLIDMDDTGQIPDLRDRPRESIGMPGPPIRSDKHGGNPFSPFPCAQFLEERIEFRNARHRREAATAAAALLRFLYDREPRHLAEVHRRQVVSTEARRGSEPQGVPDVNETMLKRDLAEATHVVL